MTGATQPHHETAFEQARRPYRSARPNGLDRGAVVVEPAAEEESPATGWKRERRLQPIPWWALSALPKREPLVKGVLDRGAFSLVYGASNCGKSFLCIDLAARIALGWDWRGRPVRKGGVVYIAAEGGLGVAERLIAYAVHHKIAVDDVPLFVLPSAIDLCNDDVDVAEVIAEIKRIAETDHVELVVVDTLSRALAGGNENSPDDMGALVKHCDRLRSETGAHVLAIHHSGKDVERGARGHNLLVGAVDSVIAVTREGDNCPSVATVTKQRDYPTGDEFSFTLLSVEIGTDEEGEARRSCVVQETGAEDRGRRPRGAAPKGQAAEALRLLRRALDDAGQPAPASRYIPANARVTTKTLWLETCLHGLGAESTNPESGRRAFRRYVATLQNAGIIGSEGEYVWIID